MKKILALLVGLLTLSLLNAGNIVDIKDMKVAKDIAFSVKFLEYLDAGEVEIQYTITLKDEVKNPLENSLQLSARQPGGTYYKNLGTAHLHKITPGKASGSVTFTRTFSLLKPYDLKQKKVVTIKEAAVPEKIGMNMVIFARKPHTNQALKNGGTVGYLVFVKDDKGKIKDVEFKAVDKK